MTRRFRLIVLITGLALLAALMVAPAMGGGTVDDLRQTWPSRTPTSSGPPEPPNPPATEPSPEETSPATTQPGGPAPTATDQAPGTGSGPGAGLATSAPAGPGTAVPPGSQSGEGTGFGSVELPPASEVGDCGLPPIAVALGPVNVRGGPGIEFDVVAGLGYQEERPVAGRAPYTPWWMILLSSGQLGWVSDQAVTIVGYTGAVPVVQDEHSVDENRASWNPTPNPVCTPPAQETVSANEHLLAAAFTVNSSPPGDGVGPPEDSAVEGDSSPDRAPGFSLLRPDDVSTGLNLSWLPVVGGFLIIAGGIALVVQRRQN